MNTTKKIAISGVFTALLIGCQFALSSVKGVEIVTALLLAFCFYFGIIMGLCVATSFSLIRCLIFGFSPTAIILYLVYYNLFALLFGLLKKWLKGKLNVYLLYTFLTTIAVLCTAMFTLLDDLITPLMYGFNNEQMHAYFILSLSTMLPHCICVAISVPLLTPPLVKVFHCLFKH